MIRFAWRSSVLLQYTARFTALSACTFELELELELEFEFEFDPLSWFDGTSPAPASSETVSSESILPRPPRPPTPLAPALSPPFAPAFAAAAACDVLTLTWSSAGQLRASTLVAKW